MIKSKQGDAWAYRPSQSGFRGSVDYVRTGGNRVSWVSWPGASVEIAVQGAVRKRLENEHSCSPIFLSRESQASMEKYCWQNLWPTLHTIPGDAFAEAGTTEGSAANFEALVHMSSLYAERVAELYTPGDVLLVYDYELMLLPALIRRRFPDAPIGFFLHCPFPSSEVFQELPNRAELLRVRSAT